MRECLAAAAACGRRRAGLSVFRHLRERHLERVGVLVLDGGVEQRARGGPSPPSTASVSARRAASRAPSALANAARQRAQPLLALCVDHRPHARTGLRVARHVRERRRQRLARARACRAPSPGGAARTRPRRRASRGRARAPAPLARRSPGRPRPRAPPSRPRRRPGACAPRRCARRCPRRARPTARPPRRAGLRARRARPVEPQLCARRVSLGEVEVRQPDERIDPRVAPGLRHRERAHQRIAHLVERAPRRLTRARQAHPDLGARGRAVRELLQRQRKLCVEVRHLARVGEEREPERRIGGLGEHAMRRGAGPHPSPAASASCPARRSSSAPARTISTLPRKVEMTSARRTEGQRSRLELR